MIPPVTIRHLGLDLAQRRDFTALATLTCEWSIDGRDPYDWEWKRIPHLILRDLERFPVGTEYLFYLDALTPAYTKRDAVLTVDASGPGGPVVAELRRANLGIEIKPLIITGGRNPGPQPLEPHRPPLLTTNEPTTRYRATTVRECSLTNKRTNNNPQAGLGKPSSSALRTRSFTIEYQKRRPTPNKRRSPQITKQFLSVLIGVYPVRQAKPG